MIRIGLYADRAHRENPTGIGRYTAGLAGALDRSDFPFDFNLYTSPQNLPESEPAYWSSEVHQPTAPRKPLHFAWHTVRWPNIECLVNNSPDIYHLMLPHPFATSKPTVTTVHDITPIQFPDCYSRAHRWSFRSALEQRLRESDHIITISESTRADIVERYDVPLADISVVYYGIEDHFHAHTGRPDMNTLARYGLDDSRYVLFVGTINPRKNLPLLANAFDVVSEDYPDLELVIVGGEGYRSNMILEAITSIESSDRVVFPGYVETEDIPEVMAGATAFVMPSLYEGFGIPVLESMACGTPVLATNVSSLPEVVGNAGILVDPNDPMDLATELSALLEDNDRRRRYEALGRERAGQFTWERAASETVAVYESVFESL